MKLYILKRNLVRQLFFFLSIALFTLGVLFDNNNSTILVSGAIAAVLLISLLYQYMTYIVINEKGVTYKSLLKEYCLDWRGTKQVKNITRWNIQVPWIILLTSSDPKAIKAKRNVFNQRDKCITFPFITEAAKEINQQMLNRKQE